MMGWYLNRFRVPGCLEALAHSIIR
jgi:hypothetical protein